jgi:hypothetical protein
MFTSVARAVGPSVNKILYFSHFQNWKFLNLVMWTHWGLNWFFLPNPIFAIWMNLQQWNSFKNQYLSHLNSENCEINSIKSDLPGTFQKHQECPQNSNTFFILILYTFHWENGSIINSFHNIAPKQSQTKSMHPSYWDLSKDTKSTTWSTVAREISAWCDVTWQNKNKTNYLAS